MAGNIEILKKYGFKKKELTEEYLKERFEKSYRLVYKKPSGVIYSTIQESLSECGYPKQKHFYLGDGWKIHLRNGWDEDKKKEFEERLIELSKQYPDVIQIEQNSILSFTANENLRRKVVEKTIVRRYNTTSRLERRKKKNAIDNSFKYQKKILTALRTLLRNPSPNFYGEYFKNSSGDVKIVIFDDTKYSKNHQYKEMDLELYEHFVKHNLLEFVEDREVYKKFYFSQEYMNNPSKYIRISFKTKPEEV